MDRRDRGREDNRASVGVWEVFRPIQHHLSFLPLSNATPPPPPAGGPGGGGAPRSVRWPHPGAKTAPLAQKSLRSHHPVTNTSQLTQNSHPKSISKESQERHEVQTNQDKYTQKTYQEDKLPLGRSQGRLGLQFTNPGTFQLLKDLLMAPMATGRTAYDLFT